MYNIFEKIKELKFNDYSITIIKKNKSIKYSVEEYIVQLNYQNEKHIIYTCSRNSSFSKELKHFFNPMCFDFYKIRRGKIYIPYASLIISKANTKVIKKEFYKSKYLLSEKERRKEKIKKIRKS